MYLFQHSEKTFSLSEIGSEEGPAPKPFLGHKQIATTISMEDVDVSAKVANHL